MVVGEGDSALFSYCESFHVYSNLYTAIPHISGTLLGGIVGVTLESALTEEQLIAWGWRIPFVSGIFVSLSSCCLGASHHHHSSSSTGPLRALCSSQNRRPLLAATMVPMLWSAGFYVSFVWMAIFMKDFVTPAIPNAFLINSTTLFLGVCLFFPVAGWLSDRYGRRRIMVIGGVSMAIWGPVSTTWIGGTASSMAALMAQFVLGISLSFWGAPMCAWLVESFDETARLTSVAVGYNLAHAIAGGSAPAIATYMAEDVAVWSPGCILSVLALVSLTGLVVVAVPRDGRESEANEGVELVKANGPSDVPVDETNSIVDDDDDGLL